MRDNLHWPYQPNSATLDTFPPAPREVWREAWRRTEALMPCGEHRFVLVGIIKERITALACERCGLRGS